MTNPTTPKQGKSEETSPTINNNFSHFLSIHREGEAIHELSEALAKVSEAALLTGRAGAVMIKFTVKAAGKTANALVIEDDITTKMPKADKVNSIFFYDHGALVRDNPKQLKLALKEVPGGAPAAIEVTALKEAQN